ncbi:MAG: hypothetical protein Q8N44_10750 [Rubrivivax sp.]|nr:hypothetical protein [Rubrivivax sp.]
MSIHHAALEWQLLPAAGAGLLAIDGELLALATLDRLQVWQGDSAWPAVASASRQPGWPRITPSHVCWGNSRIERHRVGAGAQRIDIGAGLPDSTPGAWVPRAFAWNPAGDMLLVSVLLTGPQPHARSLLLGAGGQVLAALADGQAVADSAGLGERLAILGHARASVHDWQGRLLQRLDNPTPALRLDLSAGDARLLIVEYGRLTLIGCADWQLLARWSGRWIDAALDADGERVWAVDTDGRLAALDPAQPDAAPQLIDTLAPVQGLAVGVGVGVGVGDQRIAVVHSNGLAPAWAALPPV